MTSTMNEVRDIPWAARAVASSLLVLSACTSMLTLEPDAAFEDGSTSVPDGGPPPVGDGGTTRDAEPGRDGAVAVDGGTDAGSPSDVPFNPDELEARPSGTMLQLREPPQDRLIYDSGAAFGRHWGPVPVTITTDASDGTPVEARAVALDGASVTPWGDLGVVADGRLAADLVVPLDTRWLRIEARIKGSTVADDTSHSFAMGHVAIQDGQSDVIRAYNFRLGATYETDPIMDPDALQVVYMARPRQHVVERFAVNESLERALRTPGAVALSNTLARLRPGEKFLVIVIAQSGMGLDEQLQDDLGERDTRDWADERAIAEAARIGGVDPGFLFYFFSSGTPDAWSRIVGPGVLGIGPDGSPFRPGGRVRLPGGEVSVDHVLSDLWDVSRLKLGHVAPWSDDLRAGIAENLSASAYASFLAPVPGGEQASEMVSFAKGNPNAGWSDTAHATAALPDGAARLASMLGHLMLIQWGLTEDVVPRLGETERWPNGDRKFVKVTFEHGLPAATLRSLRGASTPTGRPAVLGFTIDGARALRTSIRDAEGRPARSGSVWIERNDGRDWTGREVLGFRSRSSSFDSPEDLDNGHFVEERLGAPNPASELLPLAHAARDGWNLLDR